MNFLSKKFSKIVYFHKKHLLKLSLLNLLCSLTFLYFVIPFFRKYNAVMQFVIFFKIVKNLDPIRKQRFSPIYFTFLRLLFLLNYSKVLLQFYFILVSYDYNL